MIVSGACLSLHLNTQENIIELGVTSQLHQPSIYSTGQHAPTKLLWNVMGINLKQCLSLKFLRYLDPSIIVTAYWCVHVNNIFFNEREMVYCVGTWYNLWYQEQFHHF